MIKIKLSQENSHDCEFKWIQMCIEHIHIWFVFAGNYIHFFDPFRRCFAWTTSPTDKKPIKKKSQHICLSSATAFASYSWWCLRAQRAWSRCFWQMPMKHGIWWIWHRWCVRSQPVATQMHRSFRTTTWASTTPVSCRWMHHISLASFEPANRPCQSPSRLKISMESRWGPNDGK